MAPDDFVAGDCSIAHQTMPEVSARSHPATPWSSPWSGIRPGCAPVTSRVRTDRRWG